MGASSYLDAVNEHVVVYDGATGTWLQTQDLTADDYGGEQYEGCPELLAVTRPDVVAALHTAYFEVGADVVETNTFGSLPGTLAEYQIAERAEELSEANARIAREVADGFSTPDRPRFVAGSIGPGHQVALARPDRLRRPARRLRGAGPRPAQRRRRPPAHRDPVRPARRQGGDDRRPPGHGAPPAAQVPLQVQVTIELTGRMLLGTEIGAALTALDAMAPDIIGINCATGPSEMGEHIRHLSGYSRRPISVLPNAGLPSVVDGKMHYDLTAPELCEHHRRFVEELGVSIIGGCCGTTPEYIKLLVDERARPRAGPPPAHVPTRASRRSTATRPTTSRRRSSWSASAPTPTARRSSARRCSRATGTPPSPWPAEQIREGSHVLDVCVDYVGRDGTADMAEVASRFATASTVPLMVDSTEPQVIEAALQRIGGKAILNSVNLEDGDAPGTRLDRFLALAKEYGAAVVATCIDEEGQARTPEWKLRSAKAILDIAVDRYGLEPHDIFFDPLALTLATGIEESRGDGIATIEGIRKIKEELPGVGTILGLSNISFGLNPAARQALNSVFLHECQEAGPRRRHRARRPHRADQPPARGPGADLPRPHLRPAPPGRRGRGHRVGLRPAHPPDGAVRGRRAPRAPRRRTGPAGRSSSGSRSASSTATATASSTTSTRRWPPATRRSRSSTTSSSRA